MLIQLLRQRNWSDYLAFIIWYRDGDGASWYCNFAITNCFHFYRNITHASIIGGSIFSHHYIYDSFTNKSFSKSNI